MHRSKLVYFLLVLLALSLAWQEQGEENPTSLTPHGEILVTLEVGEAVRFPLEESRAIARRACAAHE